MVLSVAWRVLKGKWKCFSEGVYEFLCVTASRQRAWVNTLSETNILKLLCITWSCTKSLYYNIHTHTQIHSVKLVKQKCCDHFCHSLIPTLLLSTHNITLYSFSEAWLPQATRGAYQLLPCLLHCYQPGLVHTHITCTDKRTHAHTHTLFYLTPSLTYTLELGN